MASGAPRLDTSKPGLLRLYAWLLISVGCTVLLLHGIIGLVAGFGREFAPWLLALDAGLLVLGYFAYELSDATESEGWRPWSAPLWLIGPYLVLLCSETGQASSPFFVLLLVTCVFSGLLCRPYGAILLTAVLAALYGLASWMLPEKGLLHGGGEAIRRALTHGQEMSLQEITRLALHSAFLFLGTLLSLRLAKTFQAKVDNLTDRATRDPLTGLPNRRGFTDKMAQELARAQRFSWPLSVLVIDLDHFKQVNDRHGHAFGDEVLRQASDILRETVGTIDHLGRTGGEEFAIGAVAAEPGHGAELAMRILRNFRGHDWKRLHASLHVTCSIGVAVLDPSSTHADPQKTLDRLLAHADAALYRVKEGGRDDFAVHDGPTRMTLAGVRLPG